jgi:hypothetical protein
MGETPEARSEPDGNQDSGGANGRAGQDKAGEESRVPSPHDKTVVVWKFENYVEAAIAQAALEDTGIPAVIDSFHDSAYNGLFVFQKGWGRVRVMEQDAERATEVIRKALAASRAQHEETGPGDA